MKIEASSVALQGGSSYHKTESTTVESSFISFGAIMPTDELFGEGVTLEISDESRNQAGAAGFKSVRSVPKLLTSSEISRDWETNIKKLILEAFLRSIGKLSDFDGLSEIKEALKNRLESLRESKNPLFQEMAATADELKAIQGQQNDRRPNTRMVRVNFEQSSFKMTQSTEIQNSMQFSAQGAVQTADGRNINFGLEVNMSQSFYESTQFESVFQRLSIDPVFCDPLVVNFDAMSADVKDIKFSFDLDADGTSDQISRLMSGSGFLAVDTYNDGVIHDGNQLFGSQSGNGFADLAAHDGDGNGWIDENDGIFDKLRVWVNNEDGSSNLFALGELGIGAIYLGNVNTDYCLGDLTSPDGMVRKTGVFLYEDGRAGTIQHIDMAV